MRQFQSEKQLTTGNFRKRKQLQILAGMGRQNLDQTGMSIELECESECEIDIVNQNSNYRM